MLWQFSQLPVLHIPCKKLCSVDGIGVENSIKLPREGVKTSISLHGPAYIYERDIWS